MKIIDRIWVEATGGQSGYGINEIITTYAPTPAGLKKALKYAAKWHKPAVVKTPLDRVLQHDDPDYILTCGYPHDL